MAAYRSAAGFQRVLLAFKVSFGIWSRCMMGNNSYNESNDLSNDLICHVICLSVLTCRKRSARIFTWHDTLTVSLIPNCQVLFMKHHFFLISLWCLLHCYRCRNHDQMSLSLMTVNSCQCQNDFIKCLVDAAVPIVFKDVLSVVQRKCIEYLTERFLIITLKLVYIWLDLVSTFINDSQSVIFAVSNCKSQNLCV